jgi:Ca2+-binding EF-hand superfamily protein
MAPTPVVASAVTGNDLAELTLFSDAEAPDSATETETPKRELDKNEIELKDKLTRYVDEEFAGDYEAAFASFDSSSDGELGSRELGRALDKIGVGNLFTRGAWVDGIMERMDASGNDQLTFSELWDSLTSS